jgi:hypothetical protein
MAEGERREGAHPEAELKAGEDDVGVLAAEALGTGAAEGLAERVVGELGDIGLHDGAADDEAGAGRDVAEIVQKVEPLDAGEFLVELPAGEGQFLRRGRGVEFHQDLAAPGAEEGIGGIKAGVFGEVIGGEEVVVIDVDEEIAAAFAETAPAGLGEAQFGFDDDAARGMPGEIEGAGERRAGEVVDEEQFPLIERQGLLPKRLECAPEEMGEGIVRADDDADHRVTKPRRFGAVKG